MASRCHALAHRLSHAVEEDPGEHEEGIYAHFAKTADGACALQDPDGLCALHRHAGADALPRICRLYPRAIRMGSHPEISCSTGCEKTVELLAASTGPLWILTVEREYDGPCPKPYADAEKRDALRGDVFSLLSDRSLPLIGRFARLPSLLPGGKAFVFDDPGMLAAARRFIDHFQSTSPALAHYGAEATALFDRADGSDPTGRFLAGEAFVSELFPDFGILCEKLMLNHVFYEQFPYPFEERGICAGADTLFAAASLLRVATTAAGCRAAEQGKELLPAIVDAAAAVFRFVEHTDFYYNAAILMKKPGAF